MNIAIALNGNQKSSIISEHFSRCSFFAIYDTENRALQFIQNSNKDIRENAGMATIKLLNKYNVEKVVSGEFGARIKEMLNDQKIQMIIIPDHEKTLQQILDLLEKNKK